MHRPKLLAVWAILLASSLLLFHCYLRSPHGAATQEAGESAERLSPAALLNVGSQNSALPSRLPPVHYHHNYAESALTRVLRPMGASDSDLSALADGQFHDVLSRVTPAAVAGDSAAIHIYGWVARMCGFLPSEKQDSRSRSASLLQAENGPSSEMDSFRGLSQVHAIWKDGLREACAQDVDQSQAHQILVAAAANNDPDSLYLLSLDETDAPRRHALVVRSAQLGFSEAELLLAKQLMGSSQVRRQNPDLPPVSILLAHASEASPAAEGVLARCVLEGCEGAAPDVDHAVYLARDAAANGEVDQFLVFGEGLPQGKLSADELSAWRIFGQTLRNQGCDGALFSMVSGQPPQPADISSSSSSSVKSLAADLWAKYGAKAKANRGCGN